MTKSNIWSQMRLINYIMQNICGVTGEHRVNTIAQNCLEYLKDEGRISSFEINMKDNNILNINIPDMFVLDFDITTNEVTFGKRPLHPLSTENWLSAYRFQSKAV